MKQTVLKLLSGLLSALAVELRDYCKFDEVYELNKE